MNKKHYPSLDLCKKLTEINFPQYDWSLSMFEYLKDWVPYTYEIADGVDYMCWYGSLWIVCNQYVCPTFLEMHDLIPDNIKTDMLIIGKACGLEYLNWIKVNALFWCNDGDVLIDSMANMILFLHKKWYINVNKDRYDNKDSI